MSIKICRGFPLKTKTHKKERRLESRFHWDSSYDSVLVGCIHSFNRRLKRNLIFQESNILSAQWSKKKKKKKKKKIKVTTTTRWWSVVRPLYGHHTVFNTSWGSKKIITNLSSVKVSQRVLRVRTYPTRKSLNVRRACSFKICHRSFLTTSFLKLSNIVNWRVPFRASNNTFNSHKTFHKSCTSTCKT